MSIRWSNLPSFRKLKMNSQLFWFQLNNAEMFKCRSRIPGGIVLPPFPHLYHYGVINVTIRRIALLSTCLLLARPAWAQEPPAAEPAAQEQPAAEAPAEAPAAEEKPAEEKPAEEKPAEEKSAEEKPAEEKPAEEKPADEKHAAEKPAEEKPAEEKPAEEKPAEKPQASGDSQTPKTDTDIGGSGSLFDL